MCILQKVFKKINVPTERNQNNTSLMNYAIKDNKVKYFW